MARILVSHVSPTPEKLTGITIYTWRILEALVRHGAHEYVLATNLSNASISPAIRALGIDILQRNLPSNETRTLIANWRELPELQRRVGASLIFHAQPTAMLGGMKDSVVVIHDLYRITNPEFYNRAQLLQWRFGVARGFRAAGHVIAVSNATRRAVVDAYPDLSDRVTVVHEAAPISLSPNPSLLPRSEEPFALTVANITPNKNIGLLFEALDILGKTGCRPRMVIVGRDEINALPPLMARFPNVRVELKNGLTNQELVDHYQRATAFVNMSLVEGFCLPILEAQACGAPVICADIPVLHEVAGDGALFIDPRSPPMLASALHTLFTDSAVAKSLQARAYANCARFSWKKAARETEAVFDKLLADRRG